MWKGSIKISLTVNTSIPLLWAEFHQHSHAHVTARLNVSVNGITNPRKNKTYLFSFGVCLFVSFSFLLPTPRSFKSQVWKKEKTLHTCSSHKIWIYESLRLKKQKYSGMLQYILLDLHAVSHTILQHSKGTQKYRWNKQCYKDIFQLLNISSSSLATCQCLQGDYGGDRAKPFTLVHGRRVRGSGGKLKQERLRLVVMRDFSTVKQSGSVPRSLCHLPAWRFSRLNKALSNLVWADG